jgi:hypothetical protein
MRWIHCVDTSTAVNVGIVALALWERPFFYACGSGGQDTTINVNGVVPPTLRFLEGLGYVLSQLPMHITKQ